MGLLAMVLALGLGLLAMVLRQVLPEVVAERQRWLPCSERVAQAGAEGQELQERFCELRVV
jgi:hypothetical protein